MVDIVVGMRLEWGGHHVANGQLGMMGTSSLSGLELGVVIADD